MSYKFSLISTHIFAVTFDAALFSPEVEPADGAVFAAGEEGVGIALNRQELVGGSGVTSKRTTLRRIASFKIWK